MFESDKAGYVSYFQKDGSRVAKNASIYSIDENKEIMDKIMESDEPMKLTPENNAEFKYEISNFQKNFSDHNFTYAYSFKEGAKSTALEILNTAMIEHGQTVEENTGLSFSYEMVESPESGIVSYYMDNFENVTFDNVSMDLFDVESYERTYLRVTEMIPKGNPIYRLVTSEEWYIILPLTEEQYNKLSERENIRFRILKDNFETSGNITFYKGSTMVRLRWTSILLTISMIVFLN